MIDHAKPWIGRSLQTTATVEDLVLWMGCDASCASCQKHSGQALVLGLLQQNCLATNQLGVLAVSNSSGGLANCVPSLSAIHAEQVHQAETFPVWAIIVLVDACLIVLVCLARIMLTRYRQRPPESSVDQDAVRINKVPAPQVAGVDDIDHIFPCLSLESEPCCVICLQLVMSSEDGRRLQCDHEFHGSCIAAWWLRNKTLGIRCPTCRRVQVLEKCKETRIAEV
eukprot:TRINITY_DN11652_c1_g1_i1.p1 TRINITY_DN11652_c1_g1~~TRINITY_DN11652_c1_g1_i1.p1  ORF type:complete len:246 (+),score=33.38 TRINITY_DN11652_c1_g1_i1:65-739(+)